MTTADLVTFSTSLFTILNPIGGVAIFLGLVGSRPVAERRSIAIRCGIAVVLILVGTVWIGQYVLDILGVGIPSLQAAGGIMIASIALSMLHSSQSSMHESKADDGSTQAKEDVAIVPLAMPMVAGPGAIVTVMVATHQHRGLEENIELSVVCAVMAGLVCVFFLSSGLVSRILGNKGMDILTKFMGMILLAIALGMLADGVKGLLPGLAG